MAMADFQAFHGTVPGRYRAEHFPFRGSRLELELNPHHGCASKNCTVLSALYPILPGAENVAFGILHGHLAALLDMPDCFWWRTTL